MGDGGGAEIVLEREMRGGLYFYFHAVPKTTFWSDVTIGWHAWGQFNDTVHLASAVPTLKNKNIAWQKLCGLVEGRH